MKSTSDSGTSPLLVERDADVMRVVLNRPDRRNALSQEMVAQLDAALTQIADDTRVRVVLLAAEGPVFCAGHDLTEMRGRSESEYGELFSNCTEMMMKLRRLPQPVIARVQGTATAAGCQLVAACDLAVASERATFATPGVRIGLFCTTPMVPLVRAIAPRAAMEMLLTGEPIPARRARELGLVNRVVPQDELDATIARMVDRICSFSPVVISLGKAAFYDQLGIDEGEAYARATQVITRNAVLDDAQEGINAFLEKRPPAWPSQS